MQQGLHVGRVINEYQEGFARGDFLIRNVMGFDPEVGAIAIGDFARVGQTVQFHVSRRPKRRRGSAAVARRRQDGRAARRPGRCCSPAMDVARDFFPSPITTPKRSATALGEIPVAGFFAQGEMGPIGGQNFCTALLPRSPCSIRQRGPIDGKPAASRCRLHIVDNQELIAYNHHR